MKPPQSSEEMEKDCSTFRLKFLLLIYYSKRISHHYLTAHIATCLWVKCYHLNVPNVAFLIITGPKHKDEIYQYITFVKMYVITVFIDVIKIYIALETTYMVSHLNILFAGNYLLQIKHFCFMYWRFVCLSDCFRVRLPPWSPEQLFIQL